MSSKIWKMGKMKNFIKKISLSLRFRNIRKNEMKRLKKLITKKKNPRLLINQ